MTNVQYIAIIVLSQVIHLKKGEVRLEMFSINPLSGVPIYEQLYKQTVERVLKGELREGDKLPSVREAAKALGVNPNTVAKAYSRLEQDGIIASMVGRGAFIRAVHTDSIKEKVIGDFRSALRAAVSAGISKEKITSIVTEEFKGKKEEGNNDRN